MRKFIYTLLVIVLGTITGTAKTPERVKITELSPIGESVIEMRKNGVSEEVIKLNIWFLNSVTKALKLQYLSDWPPCDPQDLYNMPCIECDNTFLDVQCEAGVWVEYWKEECWVRYMTATGGIAYYPHSERYWHCESTIECS